MAKTEPEGGFRSEAEKDVGRKLEQVFLDCPDSVETKLDNFPKYIRRQKLTRLLAQHEIFKMIMPVMGSIVECGVYRGASLMAWANMSAVLEPANLTRRVYGFDTFEGLKGVSEKDQNIKMTPKDGQLCSDSYEELQRIIEIYDTNRFLGHVGKVQLIKGDIAETVPEFLKENSHLVVSLLFLDMDLYEPTKIAIENFFPRMPKGSIIAFDELDNPIWPGETSALLDTLGIGRLKLQRIEFDPYISYAVVD